MFIDAITKFNGYADLINRPISTEREIIVESGMVIEDIKPIKYKFYQNRMFRYPINMLYKFFTCLIHLFIPLYSVKKAIDKKDVYIFTSNIINLIFLTQYIAGYIYFKKNNINKLKDITYNKLYIIPVVLSFVLAVVNVILFGIGKHIVFYTDIKENTGIAGLVFLCFLLFFEKIYAYSVVLTNLCTFFAVFTIITKTISDFVHEFEKIIENGERLEISTIISEFSMIKESHKKEVKSTNFIFSNIVLLTTLSGYFVSLKPNHPEMGATQYISVVLCSIVFVFYFIVLKKVKNYLDDIKCLINSEKFHKMYKESITFNRIEYKSIKDIVNMALGKNNTEYNNEFFVRTAISSTTNQHLTEWLIINVKLSGNWESFKVLGFNVDDSTLLKKGIGIIITFFMITNLKFTY